MRKFQNLLSSLFLILLLVFSTTNVLAQTAATSEKVAPTLSTTEQESSKQVKTELIKEITTKLTDPEMEGRGTATPGGERAAKYIAEQFQKLGLKPLGDKDSYLQAIKFNSREITNESVLELGQTQLKHVENFGVLFPQPDKDINVTSEIVFAGYGLSAPEVNHDDFANVDVKGKIVVILSGRPKNVEIPAKYNSQTLFLKNLTSRGVAGIVISSFGGSSIKGVAEFLARPKLVVADAKTNFPFQIPVILADDATIEKLIAGGELTLAQLKEKAQNNEYVSFSTKNSLTIKIKVKTSEALASNVVGLLEGSDPKLKEEAIVYSAHYDAYGKKADGTIYPGAADNALGVATVISIAEAFTKSRPKRSVIFLAVTAEEMGLIGSEYWVNHPTWPLEKISANINYDGIGVETYGPVKRITGFGMEYSSLGDLMQEITLATGGTVFADPFPEEKVFYRSDHFSFVRKGVPAIMLLGAPDGDEKETIARARKFLSTDYHKPTDTIKADWNWEGPRQLGAVGFLMGLRLANSDKMAEWKPNTEFNHPRGTDLKTE